MKHILVAVQRRRGLVSRRSTLKHIRMAVQGRTGVLVSRRSTSEAQIPYCKNQAFLRVTWVCVIAACETTSERLRRIGKPCRLCEGRIGEQSSACAGTGVGRDRHPAEPVGPSGCTAVDVQEDRVPHPVHRGGPLGPIPAALLPAREIRHRGAPPAPPRRRDPGARRTGVPSCLFVWRCVWRYLPFYPGVHGGFFLFLEEHWISLK